MKNTKKRNKDSKKLKFEGLKKEKFKNSYKKTSVEKRYEIYNELIIVGKHAK